MRKVVLPFAVALLGFAALPINALAQGNDSRIDVASLLTRPSIQDYPFPDNRVRDDVNRLNWEVRRVRLQIRASGGGGRRIRYQFDRVMRATEELNDAFRRGTLTRREIRSRAQRIRFRLEPIQRELRR